ncbi:transposase [Thioalkalivibrio nitratireducens]|uniref:transposase n=1 Tax=Thioalkalivibrio nitratireducens TaxID=186931 RepID=UPI0005C1E502|nr:transposase [Thioalkalivibrio nitratireducens]
MPYPRSALVSLDATPWYHVISRCVRRAFLCGEDAVTGRNYEHRRGWIVERLEQLAGVFAIDVAAYAVMSNHAHLVLRVDAERAQAWSQDEVLRRWTRLYVGPELVQHYVRNGEGGLCPAQLDAVHGWAETYRSRLADLSWFMRVLNQSIARMANAEDQVTGRFWEGRFKSHALLDEAAVLTAMAYVDLNPIRARMATVPEDSAFTSIAERLRKLRADDNEPTASATDVLSTYDSTQESDGQQKTVAAPPGIAGLSRVLETSETAVAVRTGAPAQSLAPTMEPLPTQPLESQLSTLPRAPLMPFDATGRMAAAIPFAFDDYLELVDATGQVIREDKKGYIPGETPQILERLNIDPGSFIATAGRMLQQFSTAIGTPGHLSAHCVTRNIAFLRGMSTARALFERKAA